MRRKLLKSGILSALLLSVLGISVIAEAQRPGDSFRRDERHDDRRDNRQLEQKTGYVRRWLNAETLPLMGVLNIGPQDYGKQIESFIVEIRQVNRPGAIDLLVDSRIEASTGPNQYAMLRPNRFLRIGDFNTLHLGVRGMIYIERITVNLQTDGGWGQQRLERIINRNFNGNSRLNVDSLVNLRAYQGQRVVAVEIRARTMQGNGMASVLINNRIETNRERVAQYFSTYTFPPYVGGNVIGRDIGTLDLLMQGNFTVESVAVIIER